MVLIYVPKKKQVAKGFNQWIKKHRIPWSQVPSAAVVHRAMPVNPRIAMTTQQETRKNNIDTRKVGLLNASVLVSMIPLWADKTFDDNNHNHLYVPGVPHLN